MNKKFEKLGFYPANILMPKGQDMHKWAVVACDQFTSEPEYWQAVEEKVGDAPSTLRLILPEAKLKDPNVESIIGDINASMKKYVDEGVFETLCDSLLYVERQQSDGRIRHGLIGMVTWMPTISPLAPAHWSAPPRARCWIVFLPAPRCAAMLPLSCLT